jgi:hypothetical protein
MLISYKTVFAPFGKLLSAHLRAFFRQRKVKFVDVKNQYLSDVGHQTNAQFLTFITLSSVWALGIPLVHGVLGTNPNAGLGLTIVTSTLAVLFLIVGLTTINRYRILSLNPQPEAQDTVIAQTERKQPFTFFLAFVPIVLVATLTGHLLILN